MSHNSVMACFVIWLIQLTKDTFLHFKWHRENSVSECITDLIGWQTLSRSVLCIPGHGNGTQAFKLCRDNSYAKLT